MTITNADSTTKQKIFLVCFILDSTSSVPSSSCVDLRSENFYKNKERNKTNVSEAHFSNIKNNGDINSKSFSKNLKYSEFFSSIISLVCNTSNKLKAHVLKKLVIK